jgi:hypothetical protein
MPQDAAGGKANRQGDSIDFGSATFRFRRCRGLRAVSAGSRQRGFEICDEKVAADSLMWPIRSEKYAADPPASDGMAGPDGSFIGRKCLDSLGYEAYTPNSPFFHPTFLL